MVVFSLGEGKFFTLPLSCVAVSFGSFAQLAHKFFALTYPLDLGHRCNQDAVGGGHTALVIDLVIVQCSSLVQLGKRYLTIGATFKAASQSIF